jgi:hypothetical protein
MRPNLLTPGWFQAELLIVVFIAVSSPSKPRMGAAGTPLCDIYHRIISQPDPKTAE